MAVSLSVVVPVKDEAENAAPLAREIAAALADYDCEIIFVDDGSTDRTDAQLQSLKAELPNLRILRHGRNAGQSRAIRSGVRAANAEIVATLDGDGQNDPADIPKLFETLRQGHGQLALVSGVRTKRKDTVSRRIASRLANAIRQALLHDGAADTGCGLKVFRREAFLALPYFDNIHRYLIALMIREGYEVQFMAVAHRPRLRGASKYSNLGRMLVGIRDLIGVRWLISRFRPSIEVMEI
jgi:glycosyltransferase involved in cell wall biosynthesis